MHQKLWLPLIIPGKQEGKGYLQRQATSR